MFNGLGYLQVGATGADVSDLQSMLSRMGYIIPITGTYDEGTASAIRQIQKSQGLVADGVYDPKTEQAIQNMIMKATATTAPTGGKVSDDLMKYGLGAAAVIVGLLLYKRGL